MMNFKKEIADSIVDFVAAKFEQEIALEKVLITPTKKEFKGEYTIVVFPFVKMLKQSPETIGILFGEKLKELEFISDFNLVKGFLNLEFSDSFWLVQLRMVSTADYSNFEDKKETVLVEFSSPNTNKPLHLGHIRNILLGDSCASILDHFGYKVIRTQIVNDRGIAVCKSMVAWQELANGATPESESVKGDHFVGKYYVLFDQKLKSEYSEWQSSDDALAFAKLNKKEDETSKNFFKKYKNKFFNNQSKWGALAKEMLLKWENGDEEVLALWNKMNSWVYSGFESTYENLGVSFNKLYYESDTYLLGKKLVEEGVKKKLFFAKKDGSLWVDLSDAGMDQKIVLRADGTSVYLTQDLGTAEVRDQDYAATKMVYVVGNEQDYHFKVLFEVMKRLDRNYSNGLFHLSYGMVDLPDGRMKSREGKVVDADDLLDQVQELALQSASERGELEEMSLEERTETIRKIGLAALKYYIIRVQPKKPMTFNPKESLDMQGDTGPYIVNAYVRIKSLFRKSEKQIVGNLETYAANESEKELIIHMMTYRDMVTQAATQYDPSLLGQYTYSLAKLYHKFYHDNRILSAESESAKSFRLQLSASAGQYLKIGMNLLGVEMPERM